jgi:hypothetical protein
MDACPWLLGTTVTPVANVPWKVQQYCYFWISSEVVSADEITAALDLAPDRTMVRGSRRMTPKPVPAAHSWDLVCELHGRIDEQASEVLSRIEPVAGAVRRLVDRGDTAAGLRMVRYFDDPDGGYHAMSWWLSREQLALLAAMGASVDADEYAGDFTVHESEST